MTEFARDPEYIEKYLLGDMNPDEKEAFEKKIQEDRFLAEQVSLQKDLMIGVDSYFKEELKQELKEIESSYRRKTILKIPDKLFYGIAASFALLIVAGIFVFRIGSSSSEIYDQYMKPYPNIVNPITRSEEQADDSEKAYQYYEIGDYETAINMFENYLEENPANEAASFYLGLSHMMADQTRRSIEYLELVVNTSSRFSEPAKWYLALAFLDLGKKSKAQEVLIQITNSESAYANNAENILKSL